MCLHKMVLDNQMKINNFSGMCKSIPLFNTGIIIQWGYGAVNSHISFPISFSLRCLSVTANYSYSVSDPDGDDIPSLNVGNLQSSAFTAVNKYYPTNYGCNYIALGY